MGVCRYNGEHVPLFPIQFSTFVSAVTSARVEGGARGVSDKAIARGKEEAPPWRNPIPGHTAPGIPRWRNPDRVSGKRGRASSQQGFARQQAWARKGKSLRLSLSLSLAPRTLRFARKRMPCPAIISLSLARLSRPFLLVCASAQGHSAVAGEIAHREAPASMRTDVWSVNSA